MLQVSAKITTEELRTKRKGKEQHKHEEGYKTIKIIKWN